MNDQPVRPARRRLHEVLEKLVGEHRRTAPKQKAPPTSSEAVRRELAIRPDHREADLRALRKRFAAGNHPDRSPLALREVAEQRMKIANSIIDGEIARRRLPR